MSRLEVTAAIVAVTLAGVELLYPDARVDADLEALPEEESVDPPPETVVSYGLSLEQFRGAALGNTLSEQDAALKATWEGKAVLLATILDRLERETAAEILDAELRVIASGLYYEIALLESDGRKSLRYFYASSGDPVTPH